MAWPPYPQGRSPWYSLDRRQDGSQSQTGHSEDIPRNIFIPGNKIKRHKFI
jgi:hypothetical protein